MAAKGTVLLGAVIGAHGLKGDVKVKTFTLDPGALGSYGSLRTEDGRHFKITALRATGSDSAVVRFQGINDRNSAESLKGVKLSIARDALPEPGDNEFYHTDLIGLRAETPEGEALGQVRGVYNFGAGDVIEIEAEGEPSQMVPFTQSAVPTIDIAGGRIVVDLPKDGDDA